MGALSSHSWYSLITLFSHWCGIDCYDTAVTHGVGVLVHWSHAHCCYTRCHEPCRVHQYTWDAAREKAPGSRNHSPPYIDDLDSVVRLGLRFGWQPLSFVLPCCCACVHVSLHLCVRPCVLIHLPALLLSIRSYVSESAINTPATRHAESRQF